MPPTEAQSMSQLQHQTAATPILDPNYITIEGGNIHIKHVLASVVACGNVAAIFFSVSARATQQETLLAGDTVVKRHGLSKNHH